MADTGWLFPTAVTNAGNTTPAWSNPNNARLIDGSYASVNGTYAGPGLPLNADWLSATFTGASIPSNAEITSVDVRIIGFAAAAITPQFLLLKTDQSAYRIGQFGSIAGSSDIDLNVATTVGNGTLTVADYNAGVTILAIPDSSTTGLYGMVYLNALAYRVNYTIPPNTGWLSPDSVISGFASDSGTGSNWTNPSNAIAQDGSFASVTTSGITATKGLGAKFSTNIPDGKILSGVEVRIRGSASAAIAGSIYIYENGTSTGTITEGGLSFTTTLTTTTFGTSTNFLANNISAARVNSADFRIGVYRALTSSANTANVDSLEAKFTWSDPLASYGPVDGASAASSGGTVSWATPSNAVGSDNVYTTHTTSTTAANMPYLNVTNFAAALAAIPDDATITGITVTVERKYTGGSTGNVRDNTVQLMKAGTRVGTNKAVTGTNWTTSDLTITYGGAGDLWGTTWTVSDLKNANFGVSVRAIGNGTSANRVANIDAVRVSVSYAGGNALISSTASNTATGTHTATGYAEQILPAVTDDVIALVHMNEASFDTRPTKLVNSSPTGLTFTNQGSDNLGGGRFWFGGEGPFGQGLNTQGDSGAGVAIVCDQAITVRKGITHEGFFMEFDADGRSLWEIRENVADNPAWWINVSSISQGSGTWTLQLDMKLPGYSQLTVQTSVFTANGTGNGNWVVTQWNDDGTFDIYVQGNRLLHTTQAFDVVLTAAKLAIFGSYRGTYAGGLYGKLIGEFRFSKKQQYTGTSIAVPTARYTDPTLAQAEVFGTAANTATGTHTAQITGVVSGTAANTAVATHSVSISGKVEGTAANTATGTHTATSFTGTLVYGSAANTASGSHAFVINGTASGNLANNATSTQTATLAGVTSRGAANTATGTQTASIAGVRSTSAANTATGTQSASLTGTASGTAANTATGTHTANGFTSTDVFGVAANTATGTHSVTCALVGVMSASNTATGSQNATLSGTTSRAAANTSTASHSASVVGVTSRGAANTATGAQTAEGSAALAALIANIASGLHTATLVGVGALPSIAQAATGTQAAQLRGATSRTAANTGTAVHTASLGGVSSQPAVNLGTGLHSVSMEGKVSALIANLANGVHDITLLGTTSVNVENLSEAQHTAIIEGVVEALAANEATGMHTVLVRVSQLDPDRLLLAIEHEDWVNVKGKAVWKTIRTKAQVAVFVSGSSGVLSQDTESAMAFKED